MRPSIKKLKKIHKDLPIAVLGGGPSLPDDLKKVPEASILMAVNHHALLLKDCEYMVFCDIPINNETMWDAVCNFKGIKISTIWQYSDYRIDVDHWDGGFSSSVAAWLACYMGGDPVLLCGMDCYRGSRPYFHSGKDDPSHMCQDYPLENHINAWRPALSRCKNSQVIKAVSGPLVDVFGEYKS